MVGWLGCVGAQPWSAIAQRRGTTHRIGIVSLSTTTDIEGAQPRSPQAALLRAMSKMGYAYGKRCRLRDSKRWCGPVEPTKLARCSVRGESPWLTGVLI